MRAMCLARLKVYGSQVAHSVSWGDLPSDESRRQAEQEPEFKPLPRGWCVGSEAFRAETTVTVSWIAQRLVMGTRGHLAHLLYRKGRTPPTPSQFRQPTLNI